MTTFLMVSMFAINIVLLVAHKRLNNRCEMLEVDLNRERETSALWKHDFERLRNTAKEYVESTTPMSKRI